MNEVTKSMETHMSDSAFIDSRKGPHAAADLSDHQIEYLSKLVMWEVAIRLSKDDYIAYLERLLSLRDTHGGLVDQAKQERELMQFEAQVLADLADLPVRDEDAAA